MIIPISNWTFLVKVPPMSAEQKYMAKDQKKKTRK